LLAAILYQRIPDRKHKLWNIRKIEEENTYSSSVLPVDILKTHFLLSEYSNAVKNPGS
jgi:hypothetical protein